MMRKPRRIIEADWIEDIGPITAREMLAMPEDEWGLLRDRITDRPTLSLPAATCSSSAIVRGSGSKPSRRCVATAFATAARHPTRGRLARRRGAISGIGLVVAHHRNWPGGRSRLMVVLASAAAAATALSENRRIRTTFFKLSLRKASSWWPPTSTTFGMICHSPACA